MTQSPEIIALAALAAAGNMRVAYFGDDEICISAAHGATITLQREGAGVADNMDPTAPWELQFEFRVGPGQIPTDLDELKGKLVAALIRFAALIGAVGAQK